MAHPVAPREDRTALGLGAMAVAVFFFTCIDSSAKWLVLAGLPALQVVFARYSMQWRRSISWLRLVRIGPAPALRRQSGS